MNVLVIDNDNLIREGLLKMIKKYCPQITAIYEATGVVDGINKIAHIEPDIVFLDVEMNDGTGFDLLKKIEHFNFSLIFITAYNKYAVTAFKYSAIDFLEKPIDPSELIISINKAIENLKNKALKKQVQILEESLNTVSVQSKETKKIALNDGKVIHFLKIADIVYCKADGAYTTFILSNNKNILISKNLKEFEDLLLDFGFYRTHHAILVNLAKVEQIVKGDNATLTLEGGHTVPISTRKKESVFKLFEN
jgi:two-component system LytT family response regulator